MISIKDTISRLGRSVRLLESHQKSPKPLKSFPTKTPKVSKDNDVTFTSQEVEQFKPLLSKFQTKVFQDFLGPLDMPNLKIYSDELPEFDEASAKRNWKSKNTSRPINLLNNFLQDRGNFDKMMDLLVRITPYHLKNVNLDNDLVVSNILREQEQLRINFQFPKNIFTEVPPIPSPLTKESFEEYIYLLTHSTFHYRNSSSLTTGIIPDILLYTHKLSNEEFKPFRSAQTYNYLIKYFGYDKNQSSFARQLLLVMNKDDCKPNIGTINNLLKVCQIHSHIRSTGNTYSIVLKYLRLCTKLDIHINLSTFTRVYDCINNIFLKEIFINKIQAINLPIQKNLLVRILDDFSLTIKETSELIYFIENDLRYTNWREDSKILNKVIYHQALIMRNLNELRVYFEDSTYQIDEYTIKSILEAIKKNKFLEDNDRIWLMLKVYVNLSEKLQFPAMDNVIRVYQFLIEQVIQWDDSYIKTTSQLIRFILNDATESMRLPTECINSNIPENYKIMKRIFKGKLEDVESKIAFFNKTYRDEALPRLMEPLNAYEIELWKSIKQNIDNIQSIEQFMDLSGATEVKDFQIDPSYIDKYHKVQKHKFSSTKNKKFFNKLQEGADNYTHRKMVERMIIADDNNNNNNNTAN
ncbi:hypothetical protein DFJ63DRAFT_332607 [Scheffersomyces coipomensis]|uniref:uncharacterized protein n=1 Tax=Scheffersomyces coipomensis TaxID=1788519 RepID=UPI00315DDB5E